MTAAITGCAGYAGYATLAVRSPNHSFARSSESGEVSTGWFNCFMPEWEHFAEVSGGAAGALVGLLFVAISINAAKIARSVEERNRAGQILVVFTIVLLTAILLAVPSQSSRALGAELLVVTLVFGIILEILERRAKRAKPGPIGWLLKRVNANIVAGTGPAITGALLLAGVDWAMFVLVASTCFSFISGLASAWFLLTRLAD